MGGNEQDRYNFKEPILRKDAGKYSLRWKTLCTISMMLAYCAVVVGVRYAVSGDSIGETLSSPQFYFSALGTLLLILGVFWLLTDRNRGSKLE